MTQEIDKRHCPDGCPFLKIEPQVRGVIPYHCELFETYLAYDTGILRCAACLGEAQHGVEAEGLGLISATPGKSGKSSTKWAFHRFSKEAQATFVDYLKQFGKGIALPKSVQKLSAPQLADLEKQVMSMLKDNPSPQWEQSADRKEINDLLDAKNEQFPGMLDKQTNQLIVNLYLVMDATEQSMLKSILNNPKSLDAFLEKLQRMPRNDSLLKNVRREMTDLYDAQEKEREQILLEIARQRAMSHGNR